MFDGEGDEAENEEHQIAQGDANQVDQDDFKLKRISKPWKRDEDEALIRIMEQHSDKTWKFISQEINSLGFQNRSANACFSRWNS